MEKTLPLYLGSSVIGSVVCRDDSPYIHFSAKTFSRISGICRAYVKGNSGDLLIGVLAPDGPAFTAKKTVTVSSLRAKGLSFDSITYASAESSSESHSAEASMWKRADSLSHSSLYRSEVSALLKSTDALVNISSSLIAIAVPLITPRPFPRPDLLCIITPISLNGTLYGALSVSGSGELRRYAV